MAEDNETNRLVVAALLEPIGAEITMAGDGREAVEAFAKQDFDLVLMDIQMPRMNGIEATLAIRRAEGAAGRGPTPILAVSANVMTQQLAESQAAGMTGVVAKPIQAEILFREIERVLVQPPASAVDESVRAEN